ncbi:MAG: protease inhibitor I42 family protein [Microthrixaceae bacterium]
MHPEMSSDPRRGRRVLAAGAALVLAAAGTVACSSSDSEGATTTTSTAATSSSTTTTAEDASIVTQSGPIALDVGATATIEMEANVTTGYEWTVVTEPDSAVVTIVSNEYVPTPTEQQMAGSGGTQRLVIEGVAPGTTTLELQYVRSFETDHTGAQTATFDITVS